MQGFGNMNFYCRQANTFELGNFINCTPTLRALYTKYGKPVPVLFENDYLSAVFKKAKFMKRVHRPHGRELVTSKMINNDVPDWQYIYDTTAQTVGGLPGQVPHTYIDQVGLLFNDVVILRGCLQAWKFPTKDPGEPVYFSILQKLLELGYTLRFVGTESDRKHSKKLFNYFGKRLNYTETTLKEAVACVNSAPFVVGNDTGLMHAAAALRKKAFCMWHHTLFQKNRTPGDYVKYSFKHHISNFKQWISALQ